MFITFEQPRPADCGVASCGSQETGKKEAYRTLEEEPSANSEAWGQRLTCSGSVVTFTEPDFKKVVGHLLEMFLKRLTKSLWNHEPKNITLLQHLEVPPCSPLLPPQMTPWHPRQHALSCSSCLPASPSNFNRLQQLSGHRPLLSLRDTQKQWQGGPKIQTTQNNNTNWPHRDHKLSSERHRSELIRPEPHDLVKKSRCDDCGQYCDSPNPKSTPKVLFWICFVEI